MLGWSCCTAASIGCIAVSTGPTGPVPVASSSWMVSGDGDCWICEDWSCGELFLNGDERRLCRRVDDTDPVRFRWIELLRWVGEVR